MDTDDEKQERGIRHANQLKFITYGKDVLSAQMLKVSLVEMRTLLGVEHACVQR